MQGKCGSFHSRIFHRAVLGTKRKSPSEVRDWRKEGKVLSKDPDANARMRGGPYKLVKEGEWACKRILPPS
jgi:hypothetical protein